MCSEEGSLGIERDDYNDYIIIKKLKVLIMKITLKFWIKNIKADFNNSSI